MGIGKRVSDAIVNTPLVGMSKSARSFGSAIKRNPKKSMAIGAAGVFGYGAMRGRRGSGTGSRMPGAQKGIRNY